MLRRHYAAQAIGEIDMSEAADVLIGGVRDKILHTLTIYPGLSPSMLGIGIGTAIPSDVWKPILNQLEDEHLIKIARIVKETPGGRQQMYTVITLWDTRLGDFTDA